MVPKHGGDLSCEVTRRRRNSTDLPQGALEVPCLLLFSTTKEEDIETLRKKKTFLLKKKQIKKCLL